MATNRARMEFGALIKALGARNAEDKTDGQLLERFLNERDEAALVVLVRRHASMVLRGLSPGSGEPGRCR